MTDSDPRSDMRRSDRGRDDDWIRAYLQAASFGFLATVKDGQPFLNSNIFVYDVDRHVIYLHTARTGRTQSNLSEPVQVAFSTATMGRLLPAPEALEFSVEFSGVVVFGTGRPYRHRSVEREREVRRTGLRGRIRVARYAYPIRAASVLRSPRRRHLNRASHGFVFPSTRSEIRVPISGANLNP